MGIDGSKLNLMRQRLYIPAMNFSGVGLITAPTITTADDSGSPGKALGVTTGALSTNGAETGVTGVQAPSLYGCGTGDPVVAEVATAEFAAVQIGAAGDDVRHMMAIPANWDRQQAIRVRAIWHTLSSTTTDTATWKFLYKVLALDTTVVGAAPATALDTAIAADTNLGAGILLATPWGIINAGKLDDDYLFWSFLMELDACDMTLGSEATFLHGIEFEYSPKYGQNSRPRGVESPSFVP